MSFWAGRAAALRLSVPPSAVPASPWEGRTSGAGGGSRQPELPRQALGSRRDDPAPDRACLRPASIRRPPRRPPFLCSIASAFLSSTLQGGGPPPSPLCPEPAGLPECRAYSAALPPSLPPSQKWPPGAVLCNTTPTSSDWTRPAVPAPPWQGDCSGATWCC